jgi:hypothetical protein
MKKVAVLAIAMGGVLALASPAAARVPNHATTVTIDFVGDVYGGTFFGEVDSNKGKCRKDRKVKVKTTDAYGGITVGIDFTNNTGEYAVVDESVAPAQYVAVARKVTIKKNNGKKKFKCKKGVSPTISAP